MTSAARQQSLRRQFLKSLTEGVPADVVAFSKHVFTVEASSGLELALFYELTNLIRYLLPQGAGVSPKS